MFKSSRVVGHIVRGALGFGLLLIGLLNSDVFGWWTLLPLAGALVCFRGCPLCWTVGLVETVLHLKSHKGCIDGSCAPDLRARIPAAPPASSAPR